MGMRRKTHLESCWQARRVVSVVRLIRLRRGLGSWLLVEGNGKLVVDERELERGIEMLTYFREVKVCERKHSSWHVCSYQVRWDQG